MAEVNKPPGSPTCRWCLDHPGVVLTASAAAIYASLWIIHNAFYWQFGVRPEEVDVSYGSLLVRATGLFVLVVMVFVMQLFTAGILVGLPMQGIEALRKLRGQEPDPAYVDQSPIAVAMRRLERSRILTVGFVLLAYLATCALGVSVVRRKANRVRLGESVGIDVGWGFVPDPFAIRAPRADVRRVDGDELADTLVYIGTNGSTSIFYDFKKKQTVRIPSGAIIVTVDTDEPKSQSAGASK